VNNKVKEYRLKRGLSQEELAKLCSMPRSTLSAIESGRAVPSVEYAIKLSKALGCTVEELFGEEEKLVFLGPADGPFVSARVGEKLVIYPMDARILTLLPPDGTVREGKVEWFNKSTLPTYVFAGCDTSFGFLSYELVSEGVRTVAVYASSRKALRLLKDGYVHMAGVHLGSFEENLREIKDFLGSGYAVIRFFSWEEGVLTRKDAEIKNFKDLKNRKLVWLVREEGSGSRKAFEEIKEEVKAELFREVSGGHRELAFSIKNAFGDAGIGTRLFACEYGLEFLSVRREDYCLCSREALEEDKAFTKVLSALVSRRYREFLKGMPGYFVEKSLEKMLL
jgi:molybdate-binding protein/DNA-binding XRE family transcriptional regulator